MRLLFVLLASRAHRLRLYPVIDRPDRDNLLYWHRLGLWDAAFTAGGLPEHVLPQPCADAAKTQVLKSFFKAAA